MEVNAHQYGSQDSELLAHYYGLCNREAILSLIARLRAAEKDAARYRWLRDKAKDHASQAPAIVMLTGYCQPAFDKPGSTHLSMPYGEHAEIAIDTAMEQKP